MADVNRLIAMPNVPDFLGTVRSGLDARQGYQAREIGIEQARQAQQRQNRLLQLQGQGADSNTLADNGFTEEARQLLAYRSGLEKRDQGLFDRLFQQGAAFAQSSKTPEEYNQAVLSSPLFDQEDKQTLISTGPEKVMALANQVSGAVNQQFGGQEIFKDSKNNMFFGTTRKDPRSGTVTPILTPIGNAPAQPIGNVQRVNTLGLTAEQQVTQKGAESAATEGEKLKAQAELLPKIRGEIKQAETQAAARGEKLTELQRMQAAYPGLQEVVQKLGTLADAATYTMTGRGLDLLAKELGFGSTKGATARSMIVAVVDNQVLPLLRDTFGAAFTVAEGDSLRASLLDVNATPEQKKAVLQAFIEQKRRDIETKQREVGLQSSQQPQQGQQQAQPQQNQQAVPNIQDLVNKYAD
jgi:hypothetical protein